MPTTYAHDLFGKRVFQRLDDEIQKIIKENQALFQIGVHGPDILFYHKPFTKNHVSETGSRMHREIAASFFLKGKALLAEQYDDALLAYLLGFICHYMLDSTCHPYINAYVDQGYASHDAVETDFDRYLMEKTAKDLWSYKPGNVIIPSQKAVSTISRVIEGVSEKELWKALKGIRFYTGITVGNKLYRTVLTKAADLIGFGDYASGRVFQEEPFASCIESTAHLAGLYEKAIPEAAEVLTEYVRGLGDVEEIGARFHRNYE